MDLFVRLDTLTKGQANIQFGIGTAFLIGTIHINNLIGKIQFYIVQANTPFLLCLADMDELQVYYNNFKNVPVTHTKEVPIV